ncbi:hypothetical protein BC936DRAFT_141099 [Jimgerdemannia flammicorona]|uniref:Alginate lyase domain-containing protein n=1 Tax=Jimgerdemannia flammicorona TaxID=994334 RepID=A0A433A2W4_9FUNG|nr:hypothetical protein BC936DRAFT_141099 [Jimgerdemannia flammicorona]
MGHVIYWVTREALAYYMFGEEHCAAEAATLLRKWFIVSATKMNPNLNWAQAIRGNGKGSCVGRPEDIVESLLVGSKVVDKPRSRHGFRIWLIGVIPAFKDRRTRRNQSH